METIVQKTGPLSISEKVSASCPECSKVLKINKAFSKRLTVCQYCKTILTVPTHDTIATQSKAESGKKCPNCFEYNDSKATKCAYCSEFLGKYEFKEMCPNCKEEQDPQNKYCCKCGVNLKTGLCDGIVKRACPRCGILSSGMEKVCVVCHTPLDISPNVINAEKTVKAIGRVFSENVSRLFLLAIVVAIVYVLYHGKEIVASFNTSYYGPKEAQLREAVYKYIAALKYGDWETLSQMSVPSRKLTSLDFARTVGIAEEKEKTFYELVDCTISQIMLKENTATIYADVVYKKYRPSSKVVSPGNSLEALEEISKKLKQQNSSPSVHVSWKWSFSDLEWKRTIE